jgi:hypothetical protein
MYVFYSLIYIKMSRPVNAGLNTIHEYIAKAHKRIDLIQGRLVRKGYWDAVRNLPELSNGGVGGETGDFYVVLVSGTTNVDGQAVWLVGDWILNTGTAWERASHSGGGGAAVFSVNGQIGNVVIDATDVGLGNVSNESKATMFNDSALTGTTTIQNVSFGTQQYSGGGTHNLGVDGLATNVFSDTSIAALPTTPLDGTEYLLINGGTGVITATATGGNTIFGLGITLPLLEQGESVRLRFISGVWYTV